MVQHAYGYKPIELQPFNDATLCTTLLQGVHPTMGIPHAKFNDYSFDVEEFMRLVIKLADGVLERKMAVHSQKIL